QSTRSVAGPLIGLATLALNPMVRFQRQPPGTAVTRSSAVAGLGCAIAASVWVSFDDRPEVAVGALVALCASYLSSYVRARGAALGYSVEESHVTRGLRYALVSLALVQLSTWPLTVA